MHDIISVDMSESKETDINISHNYSDREYAKRNLEKYFVFSHTIERLIFQEEIKGLADYGTGAKVCFESLFCHFG